MRLWLGKIDFLRGFIIKNSKKEEPLWRFIKNIRFMNSWRLFIRLGKKADYRLRFPI